MTDQQLKVNKTMHINTEKLESLIAELAKDVGGWCLSSSVFIGTVKGRPVRIEVLAISEAEEEHDFDGVTDKNLCIQELP